MQEKKIGFIGGGAIAEAILSGMLQAGLVRASNIHVAEIVGTRRDYLQTTYQVQAYADGKAVGDLVDVLFLTVKPQVVHSVLKSIYKNVRKDTLIISVVAGFTIESLQEYFPKHHVIRVMPNTPVAVGEGMAAITLGQYATEEDKTIAMTIFSSVGKAVVLSESAMDAVTGLSGSGPGYAFVIIDALADAGVKMGLPRDVSITLAAQTLLGSAKMVLETGQHPAQLRDMVTSPGGTTIAGIYELERQAVRGALIDAVEAATNKSRAMGKKNG